MRPVVASFIDTEGRVRDRKAGARGIVERAREAIVRWLGANRVAALEMTGIMVDDVLVEESIAPGLN